MGGSVVLRLTVIPDRGANSQVVRIASGESWKEHNDATGVSVQIDVMAVALSPRPELTAVEHLQAALELLGVEPPEWED